MRKIIVAEIAVLLALLLTVGVLHIVRGTEPGEEPQDSSAPSSSASAPATQTTTGPTTQPTTQPNGTDPTVTEPLPTEPPPTEPQPTEQPPTEPQPTEPPPTDPQQNPLEAYLAGTELNCRDYFIYDCSTGQYLALSCERDTALYPASITKLYSIYVALQYLQPEDVVTAGSELDLVASDSSIAYIRKGHKVTVTQLVQGMLLPSGNDAAYILAAAAGRAEQNNQDLSGAAAVARFVEMMNETAHMLGMTGSSFRSPDGYHHDEHYITVKDMVLIARLAMENDLISSTMAMAQVRAVYVSGESMTWRNTNKLVDPESEYYIPEVVGMKTGYTGKAGACLMAAFRMDGRDVIVGIFGCEEYADRFEDAWILYQAILEFA